MSPRASRKTDPNRSGPATVTFVGAGPGDPSLLTLAAVRHLGRADAVIIDSTARDDLVAEHLPEGVEIVDAGHGEAGQQLTHASRAKLVVKTAKAHRGGHVVRLMDGDPGTFNGLAEEARALVKAGIAYEIVPGVSSVSAVPTYAGVPLTVGNASSVHVISVTSGRTPDLTGSVADDITVVLLGQPERLVAALAALRDAGRPESTPVALTERGTTRQQRTVAGTLAEVETLAAGLERPALAVVGPPVELRDELSWFETKPLFGWQVLVPRTKQQSGSMEERLGDFGATSKVVPTISVEPPRTPQAMERAVRGLVTGRYEWVGFTSVNAVRAVREKFEVIGLDARAFAGLKVAAVGGATAAALEDWGIAPDLVPSGEKSAAGLLEDWPPYDDVLDPINRVLLPRADIATETLVAGLQGMGWEVDDVTAYRTVRASPPPAPTRDAIKAGAFDAVAFTSSSTVRNLIGIAGKPHPSTVVACIGPATAKTAEELGLRVDVVASEADAVRLVEDLADHARGLIAQAVAHGEPVRRPSEKVPATSRRRAKAKG
ncbi:bifunctional uroporphyrinogen-III C-methyltransferase/uroporphyrinogen-III synthase [Janibacter sp. YIM B02568]|uniref:uroporphyrinogen-III synthase n=1 Tax=Janibacter endophyticus TaxID=2806261 RepID=UPI00194F2584|nr:bifunctional uroporphyrinogen-III C-methyltransferase/uroporphyrinogen-III synthase [Janibacter endophyticus]MBM6547131.1 bifunctional uroporphyrinogen-III C-methyltransferase/uroporphyrinogen-III synthase [Janibacter endophyticus]